jgi:hypothetical protein
MSKQWRLHAFHSSQGHSRPAFSISKAEMRPARDSTVNYYARWKFISHVMVLLQKVENAGEVANLKVMTNWSHFWPCFYSFATRHPEMTFIYIHHHKTLHLGLEALLALFLLHLHLWIRRVSAARYTERKEQFIEPWAMSTTRGKDLKELFFSNEEA